jgi:ABC-2 type transport system permease protein
MYTIFIAELRMLVRNRLVAACALLIPVLFAVALILGRDNFGGSAIIAPLLIVTVSALGVYVTATTTLAARRQNLFLKRLRSTTANDSTILASLVSPILLVNVIQLAVVLIIVSAVGTAPDNVVALVIAILAVEALFIGLALATAGLTNSPEHAQVTTLPIFFLTVGAAIWVATTGTQDLAVVKRLLPGGAATELIIEAWNGTSFSDILSLLLPTLAWVIVGFVLARQYFKWEPRR